MVRAWKVFLQKETCRPVTFATQKQYLSSSRKWHGQGHLQPAPRPALRNSSGKTCYGRITAPNSSEDPISSVEIKMETDCALWILDEANLAKLKKENLALYTELLLVTLCMNQDRLKELLGHCLVSS